MDAQADYGNASGYFVRIDVRRRDIEDGGNEWAFVALDADEAEALGRRLIDMAEQTRRNAAR